MYKMLSKEARSLAMQNKNAMQSTNPDTRIQIPHPPPPENTASATTDTPRTPPAHPPFLDQPSNTNLSQNSLSRNRVLQEILPLMHPLLDRIRNLVEVQVAIRADNRPPPKPPRVNLHDEQVLISGQGLIHVLREGDGLVLGVVDGDVRGRDVGDAFQVGAGELGHNLAVAEDSGAVAGAEALVAGVLGAGFVARAAVETGWD